MVNRDIREVKILEITDPWNFLAIECSGGESVSGEANQFSQMMDSMNVALNTLMEQGTVSHRPSEGEICAALNREDGRWHRVRLESWLVRNRGQYASCYLVDKGCEITVPVQRLMKLPTKYESLPEQVLYCSLWGIQPLSLKVMESENGLQVQNRPCEKWDPSATQFMIKRFDTSRKFQVVVMGRNAENKLYVRLLLNTKHGTVCFNDMLVEENYAVGAEGQDHTEPHPELSKPKGVTTGSSVPTSEEDSNFHPPSGPNEDMPPLIVEVDKGSHHSDNDDCPALVAETDFDPHSLPALVADGSAQFNPQVAANDHALPSAANELQPSVAAFFKQCLSSPEKMPPLEPVLQAPTTAICDDLSTRELSSLSPSAVAGSVAKSSSGSPCPALVAETDFDQYQNISGDSLPPLVADTADQFNPQVVADASGLPSAVNELQPSVAAFFKECLSSPEKMPPLEPVLHEPTTAICDDMSTPEQHLSLSPSAVARSVAKSSPHKSTLLTSSKTAQPSTSSSSSSSSSLSSIPNQQTGSKPLSTSSPTQASSAVSKFLLGRGRGLLSPSVPRKPGHVTPSVIPSPQKLSQQQSPNPSGPTMTDSSDLPKQTQLDISARGSSPKLVQTNQAHQSPPAHTMGISTASLSSPAKHKPLSRPGAGRQGSQMSSSDTESVTNLSKVKPASVSTKSPPKVPSPTVIPNGHRAVIDSTDLEARPENTSLNDSVPHPSSVSKMTPDSSVKVGGITALEDKENRRLSPHKSPSSDGGESTSSGIGTRARFRRSGDSLMELKKQSPTAPRDVKPAAAKIVKLLETSAPDLRDKAFRQLRGQTKGRKLLETLRQSSGQIEGHPAITRPDQPLPRPVFGVLVHGKSLPVLTCDVADVPFDSKVKQILEQVLGVDTARSIQAYVWPAALACRHIIGVCPPEKGKTMSYIPAIMSLLSDKTTYVELPKGKGPLALIVVPTWKKARDVFEMIERFTKEESLQMKRIRPLVLYAGGTEDQESTQMALITGCEILIGTPDSVLRMHEQELTSFKRLCHVVLDDADVLANRFANQIEEIMQLYRLVFKDRIHQAVPRQIMMFASRWTDSLDQFRLRYTREPIIAISSRVEASVYGGIKQVVTMSRWDQRLSTFCSLLDTLVSTEKRVAAFTSDVEEAVHMWKGAKSRGVYCLLIHHDLPLELMTEAREQWLHSSYSKQLIVMVCTDQCYQDLAVTNATDVIHYGLPDSKTKFGNRLACMFDYFRDRTFPEESEVEAISHVILTEKCAPRAEQLYEILQRCPSDYSPQLCEFLRGYKESEESDERKILCPLLKAFGTCIAHNNQERCKNRHIMIPRCDLKTGEADENSLPASGQVTIKVLRVVTAGRYYCHLVRHQKVGDPSPQDMRLIYMRLAMDLITFFSKTSNQVPYLSSDDPFHDGLCAFKDEEGVFSRAKVLEVREGTRSAPMKQCKVWLVDAGCYKYGTIDQLLTLPRSLAEVPYQAVEVFLCCVKPMDDDREWTDQADMHVHYLVEGKELVGRIMLRAGMTLWLMPLVHQVALKNVGVTSDINIRQELLGKKFAVKNSDHMKMLYELFRGKTDIPETLMRQYFDYCLEIELTQETLPANEEEFIRVQIAAIINPGLFYLHREGALERLEELEAEIETAVKEMDEASERGEKMDASMTLGRGSVCLALSGDERWYRAKLVSDCMDGQWEVFFLDYGDREWISQSSLRGLPRSLGETPCQAIECELAYVSPSGEDWSPDTVDILCDLSYFLNEGKKLLYAKVVSMKEPCYGMGMKLVVDVYETLRESVRFSHELVKRQRAVVAVDDEEEGQTPELQPIVGKPALKNQKFFNPLDKLKFLSANLYWAQDSAEALQQAEELRTLLSFRIKGWDSALDQRQVLPSVVQVVGYVPDAKAHEVMLLSLAKCCVDSSRLCDAALEHGLLERLSSSLEQKSAPDIQAGVAKAVAHLATCDSFREECLETNTLVLTMEQLLSGHSADSPVSLEVLKNICTAASQLIHASHESLPNLCSVDVIIKVLAETTEDCHREPWLELLAAMATKECTHAHLMRQASVTVLVGTISACSCPKCLYHSLSVCLSLVEASRKHKKELLENKLLIILNGLLENGLTSPALEVCQELKSAMTLHLPAPEVLSGIPALNNNYVNRVRCPEVLWSQNCFRVVLKVKVRNAQPEDFALTSDRIHCRVKSEDTLYEFDWELYDTIMPGGSKIDVQPAKTVISLRKVTKGQWNRLCKDKQKIFSLKPDLDHLYNSDSDVEEVEDDENLTKLTQKIDLFKSDGKQPKLTRKFQSSDESSDDLAKYSHSDNDEPKINYKDFLI